MNKLREEHFIEKPLPKAVIKKARPAWLLWLIPLGAAALCVWFIYRDYVAAGPLITIFFQNCEGLEEGNTQVQYRGAQVGEVKTINLSHDGQRVKVTARLTGSAKSLARVGSLFWIVRPEVKVGGISGLRTIVSGEYVTVQPGNGAPTNIFVAAEEPPAAEEPEALLITIRSQSTDSLEENSPVFYRGVQVGEVLDLHIGLFTGAEMSAQSAQTLFSGGIEFATPPEQAEAATNGAVFELNEKPKDAWKDWSPSIPLHLPGQSASSGPHSASEIKLE